MIARARAFAIAAHGDQVRKYTGLDGPHPCIERCFRVGAAIDISPGEKCTECGMPWPKATPYWHHCEEVAELVSRLTDDPEVIAAAWLHDTIEDTAIIEEDISKEFGWRVGRMVTSLSDVYTHQAFPDLNRKKRKAREARRLGKCSAPVRLIKLCDVQSNAPSIEKHGEGFAKVWKTEKAALVAALLERI